jgi:hypothetical protein
VVRWHYCPTKYMLFNLLLAHNSASARGVVVLHRSLRYLRPRSFPGPMNPRKNDVLASNLLFITLLLTLAMRVYRWTAAGYDAQTETSYVPVAFPWRDMLGWTLLAVLVRSALYYGVRRGSLVAKLLLVVVLLYSVYSSTQLQYGFVAGVDFANPSLWLLPVVVENLLTLAALVLMFRKPRVAVAA